jgi:hypothetical protein
MAIENVQTLADGTGHYRQSTPLDGQVFVLHFNFNTRDGNWYLSVHDSEDTPIRGAVGRKLVVNYPVLQRCYVDERPAGELLVVSEDDTDPGLFDLGNGTILSYVPVADVEASAAGEEIA